MSLSPAALALEADLCLLTRLPLPKEADLDAIKERVFGSVEGVPRTEDASRRRYVDPIVQAFNAAGVTRIEQFPERVRRLIVRSGTVIAERDDALDDLRRVREEYDALRQERDDARAALAKAHERIERLQEINERLEARNREATQAGASFGVETCGLLAEKDAEIERLRAEHKDLVIVRRRIIDVESEGNRLRTENAKLKDSAHALITERDRLATRVREHEETLAVLRNVNADLFKAQQYLREARDESKRWHDYSVSLNAKLEKTEQDLASTRAAHAEITAAHAKLAADVTHKDRLMRDLNNALTRAREEAKTAHAALAAEQGRSDRLRAVMVDLIADLNAAKEGAE